MDEKPATSKFDLMACIRLVLTLVITYLFFIFTLTALLDLTASSELWTLKLSRVDQQIGLRVASGVLGPIVMVGITLLILKGYFPAESYGGLLAHFGFGPVGRKYNLAFSFILGVVLAILLKYLRSVFPSAPTTRSAYAVISEAPLWAQLVLSINVFTLVPVAEEFVFRGVLYKGLLSSCNKFVAATLVSVLFALAHFDTLSSGYWVNQAAAILLPVVFVVARELTGSLYSPILIHSGFNFGSIFIFYE